MRNKGWIALGVLAIAQVFQPDRSVVPNDPGLDLVVITSPSKEVQDLLGTACSDCHSDHSTYPWYSYITPVNFWLQDHIDEGREEFNMSAWGGYKPKRQRHKAEEAVELIEAEEMPLPSYTWAHGDARLDAAQRKTLVDYFNGLKNAIPAVTGEGGGKGDGSGGGRN
ncbi:MAG: heme-binding domain-containing protein [Flavobacteriales bacterium]|nr:heme-binding domain-containing protein [Flavobacteriales bacterium]